MKGRIRAAGFALLCSTGAIVVWSLAGVAAGGAPRSPERGAPGAKGERPLGVAGQWNLIFGDNFSGNTLDLSKWSYGVWPGYYGPVNGYELENYATSEVRIANGALQLKLIADSNTYVGPRDSLSAPPGTTKPFLSGAINTYGKESFTYGFFQARIFVPGTSRGSIYNWPAWWLTNADWPVNGEIDVFEGLSGAAFWNYHWGTTAVPLDVQARPRGSFTGWHTFGVDWEPGTITYYYDGRAVGSVRHDVTSAPLYLILDDAVGRPGGRTVAPSTMVVDYVRVWERLGNST